MRIGEVAIQAGVNVQTLRFYEHRGLLKRPARLSSGYRSYLPNTVTIVRFIKQTQELGFTLSEIARLLELREQRSRDPKTIRAIAEAKIQAIDDKIHRLRQMRDDLTALLDGCRCHGQSPCTILNS